MIIVDYLQLINLENSVNNRAQELAQITRSLKKIGREYKIPVIALSQVNRSAENRLNKQPLLSDLKESGSIEQDADLVLMLYKSLHPKSEPKSKIQHMELNVVKNRNGPLGKVKLRFDASRGKFANF